MDIYNYRQFVEESGDRIRPVVQGGNALQPLALPANTDTRFDLAAPSTVKQCALMAWSWFASDEAIELVSFELGVDSEFSTNSLASMVFRNPTGNAETVQLSVDILVNVNRITL